MTIEQKNTARASAIKDRGIIYLAVYRELSERFGEAEAISVMRSASRAHGTIMGETLKHLAPRDFEGLLEGYFKCPDGGATFGTETRCLDENCLEVQVMTCPLKQSWVESGCSDAEVCTLLRCATAFDEAVFETAGFGYDLRCGHRAGKGVVAPEYSRKPELVCDLQIAGNNNKSKKGPYPIRRWVWVVVT